MTTVVIAAETLVLALLTLVVAGLLRSHAEVLRRLHELGAGLEPDAAAGGAARPVAVDLRSSRDGFADAVDVVGTGLRDDAVHVAVAGARHRTLLAFLSSGCLTCQGFWEAFALARTGALDLPDDVRVVIVTKDASEESVSALRTLAPAGVPVVMSSRAWADYHVPGSPYFVFVDGPAGRVRGEGTGAHWEQVRNLLQQAVDDALAGDPSGRAREVLIDRELLAHGIAPGDPSLYRTAEQIARESRA